VRWAVSESSAAQLPFVLILEISIIIIILVVSFVFIAKKWMKKKQQARTAD